MVVIIKPLRENGLNITQAIEFFMISLPTVLSLTLPVAALFSVTFVYGRLVQEREFVACRASGVSEFSMLVPAMLLGVFIMGATLLMANFASPWMANKSRGILFQQLKNILFHKIENEGHFKSPKDGWILHASRVDKSENSLYGVAFSWKDHKAKKDRHWFATGARIERDDKDDSISVRLINLVGPYTSRLEKGGEAQTSDFPSRGLRLSENEYGRENIRCKDSAELLQLLDNPTSYYEVRDAIGDLRDAIAKRRFIRNSHAALSTGSYSLRDASDNMLRISAPVVRRSKDEILLKSKRGKDRSIERVKVVEPGTVTDLIYHADQGKIIAEKQSDSPLASDEKYVTVKLEGNVVRTEQFGRNELGRVTKSFTCMLPVDSVMERATLDNIYYNIDEYAPKDPDIRKRLTKNIKEGKVDELIGDIKAELHFRNAWGISSLVLIVIGGLLAMFVSSGHYLLTSFAQTVLLFAGTLICMKMGSRMIANPDSSEIGGIVLMWFGVAALFAADIFLFHKLSRR